MAQHTIVQLVDDLTGTVLDGAEGGTLQFGLDGKAYEIDLNNKEADKVRKALAKYVEHGREVKATASNVTSIRGSRRNTSGGGSAKADKEQMDAIRTWARDSGYEVKDRGRIPGAVLAAYHAASHTG